MMVKTLRAHNNGYGKPFKKSKGIIYNHPAPDGLIKAGLVESYEDKAKVRGRERARKSTTPNENSNSEKHDKAGGEISA